MHKLRDKITKFNMGNQQLTCKINFSSTKITNSPSPPPAHTHKAQNKIIKVLFCTHLGYCLLLQTYHQLLILLAIKAIMK